MKRNITELKQVKSGFLLFLFILIGGMIMPVNGEIIGNAELPIKRIALFTSGVGYFEHEGELNGDARLAFSFQKSAMDDALKSLTVYDSAATMPFVSYPSEETLRKTLESLRIDPSKSFTIEDIFNSLQGAEIEVFAPERVVGKIVGAHKSVGNNTNVNNSTLSVFTDNRIRVIAMKDITSYRFTDPEIMKDLGRALELILNAHGSDAKKIYVHLPANKKRNVTIGYVVESPVWKATYRLDLSDTKPFLQGWAIIDNAGDTDWTDVELSLVVGRQTSFVQSLYAPYHLQRPTLPLSIASVAQARTYDDAIAYEEDEIMDDLKESRAKAYAPSYSRAASMDSRNMKSESLSAAGANYQTAKAKDSGEQFVFTLQKPLTLERRQSAMVPLAQGQANIRKVSIFQKQGASRGVAVNPALGLELVNNTGIKLPPGPISVYDDGTYAGDALIEFLGENEKRLISYGDDLAVQGVFTGSENTFMDSVKINKGVMQITRKAVATTEYNFKNNSAKTKNILLEHPFMSNAKLIAPAKFSEKTGNVYRFDIPLGAKQDLKYLVQEEYLRSNTVAIISSSLPDIIAYTQNDEIPQAVKNALKKAAELRNKIDEIAQDLENAKETHEELFNEQERIRSNIETVGKDSAQGKNYLERLLSLDNDIDKLNANIGSLETELKKAQKDYNDYVSNLTI